MLAELMHMIACKGAVKAGQPLSATEIEALLARKPGRQLASLSPWSANGACLHEG